MNYLNRIRQGQSICEGVTKGYAQKVLLINREDVKRVVRRDYMTTEDKHQLQIKLHKNKEGILIENSANVKIVVPSVNVSYVNEQARYNHSLQFAIYGTSEATKRLILELNSADYFALVLHNSGVVEVYGYDLGLRPNGYTLDNSDGGAIITLNSIEKEYTLPYNYYSPNKNSPAIDFDALLNLANIPYRSFNTDFNSAFNQF